MEVRAEQDLSAYEPWMTGTFVCSAVFWAYDAVGLRA
jgi:putative acetyltransferase